MRSVRLSDAGGDTLEAGRARVNIKIAALGFATAGTDPLMRKVAFEALTNAAIAYYSALVRTPIDKLSIGTPNEESAARLMWAACAYAASRVGADSNAQLARAGLAAVCQSAVMLCQSMDPNGAKRGRVVDSGLELESGI